MEAILSYAETELTKIMDEWCKINDTSFTGGKMREKRGADIETFVRTMIHKIGEELGIDFIARRGTEDKKDLIANIHGKKITKKHQVDVHIYLKGEFIAVIECKSYLDSCYYVRACDDFRLFKTFGYKVKNYIFSLENAMDENTKLFTDFASETNCDIFYLVDGKRTSSKPIYVEKYKKPINKIKLTKWIEAMIVLTNG